MAKTQQPEPYRPDPVSLAIIGLIEDGLYVTVSMDGNGDILFTAGDRDQGTSGAWQVRARADNLQEAALLVARKAMAHPNY